MKLEEIWQPPLQQARGVQDSLGAPDLITRGKDATRGSLPDYYERGRY